MNHTALRVVTCASVLVAACTDKAVEQRADSLQGVVSEQTKLSTQLSAQKDSLTRVVLDADAFLGQMDSAITTVKGLPKNKRKPQESPLADQVAARKEMMERVNALVARAKQTATQLADLQKKQQETSSENAQLKAQNAAQATKLDEDAQLIADLGATIERQRTQIVTLEARLDSLSGEVQQLGTQVKTLGTKHYQAYYVIGTENELLEKGVVVREGGANLLIAHPGRTLQPARVLNAEKFTAIDQRQSNLIAVPDSNAKYRVISRQSLDHAEVRERDGTAFRGNLRITKPDEFWAPSRFLILQKL